MKARYMYLDRPYEFNRIVAGRVKAKEEKEHRSEIIRSLILLIVFLLFCLPFLAPQLLKLYFQIFFGIY